MAEELKDPVLAVFATSVMLLSIATCVCLAIARAFGPVLKFQPRRLVPWNAAGAVLACVFVVQVLGGALEHSPPADEQNSPTAEETDVALPTKSDAPTVPMVLVFLLVEAIIVSGVLLAISVHFRTTPADLGLPPNRHELAHDVFVGIIAALVAFAPVMFIQAGLKYLLGIPEQSGHELVKMLEQGPPSVGRLIVAALAAIVFAPVFEEITFRLLLQGWLERWETKRVVNDECRMTNDECSPPDDSTSVDCDAVLEKPPSRGIAGLPFGLVPITISSALFGLAHFGYGPEPVSLFALALVLGYVYYRTHRIVPCIVAHSLFNLYSVIGLWRIVFYASH